MPHRGPGGYPTAAAARGQIMEHDNSGLDSGLASLLRGDATVSRRTLLAASAKIGAALGGAALLTACGGNLNSSISPATQKRGLTALAGGTPVRGGTFTVGVLSGGQEENLFPGQPSPLRTTCATTTSTICCSI